MITSNRNIFLGIHITPKLKDALKAEVERRRLEQKDTPEYLMSVSRVGYDLLREVLITKGHEDLKQDVF